MKVEFLNDPEIVPIMDGWRVVRDFGFCVIADDGSRQFFAVPMGFETDLASVPRIPCAYLLFGGRAPKAAICHDWLYSGRAEKAFADSVFLAAMEAEGVEPVIRHLMYEAVRIFGRPDPMVAA